MLLAEVPKVLYEEACTGLCTGPDCHLATYVEGEFVGRRLKNSGGAIGIREYSDDNRKLILWAVCPTPESYQMIWEPDPIVTIHALPDEYGLDRVFGSLTYNGADLSDPHIMIAAYLLARASELAGECEVQAGNRKPLPTEPLRFHPSIWNHLISDE